MAAQSFRLDDPSINLAAKLRPVLISTLNLNAETSKLGKPKVEPKTKSKLSESEKLHDLDIGSSSKPLSQ